MSPKVPDREGWWVGRSPKNKEVITLVEAIEGDVFVAWVPMDIAIPESRHEPGTLIVVYFSGDDSSSAVRNWSWEKIEIPSMCPDFGTVE